VLSRFEVRQRYAVVRARALWDQRSTAVRRVLAAYVVTRLITFIVIYLSMATIPVRYGVDRFNYISSTNVILDGLVRWDSWQFLDIVTHGYKLGDLATNQLGSVDWFPGYPFAIKIVASFVGHVALTGVIISNIALLVALFYLYGLVRLEFDEDTAGRAVFYFASAPAAVFFSALYSESLFIAAVLASFYYAVKRGWLGAAIAGAIASATRNTGVFLVLAIALEGLRQQHLLRGDDRLRIGDTALIVRRVVSDIVAAWRSMLAAIVAGGGLVAYMVFLSVRFGDPLAFYDRATLSGRAKPGVHPLALFVNMYRELQIGPAVGNGQINTGLLLDTISLFAFVVLIVVAVRTLRVSYSVYAILTLLTPLTTDTVFSMTRYSLMIFPGFVVLARWGQRRGVDRVLTVLLSALMAYVAVTFSHGYLPI